jgi:small-conductance mechanosensitive channel
MDFLNTAYLNRIFGFLLENSLYTLAILTLMLVAKRIADAAINRSVDTVEDDDKETTSLLEKRAHTIGTLSKNVTRFVILGVGAITILSTWGVNIAPILTGAGILGLAVGFGAQSLVKDVVTGFFIILENQMNIGDLVEIAGEKGKVVSMTVRTTQLNDDDDKRIIIPNSKIDIIKKL